MMSGSPAAAMGDRIVGTDIHIVLVPSAAGPVETPTPLPFTGTITGACCPTVLITGRPAATKGSVAFNTHAHVPANGGFKIQPTNRGEVTRGSASVFICGKPAARSGDPATTCNDLGVQHKSTVVAQATVVIG